ncbi:MAG: extracellular repeat protein family [Pedosphaera sp.]|nr:extracellular repeat protein family [Pedosphaera sp.]
MPTPLRNSTTARFTLLTILLAVTLPAHAATSYLITDLGRLNANDQFSQAFGINSYGQVAGFSLDVNAIPHTFLWTPTTSHGLTGTMIDLGLCTSGIGGGFKLNDYGQVQFNRGTITPSFGTQSHAFLWTPTSPNGTNGSATDLLTLNGADGASYGYGINNAGAVVGSSYPGQCFIWAPSSPHATTGVMTSFGNSSSSGVAFAVNDASQVAGSIGVGFYGYPLRHAGSGAYATNDVIGPGPSGQTQDYSGTGYAINAVGHVAGEAVFPGAGIRPFLFTGGGNLIDFAPAGGGGHAYGINNADQVVGTYNSTTFLYSNGTNYNLANLIDPSAGWSQLTAAYAINQSGQIAGVGARNGVLTSFLMTPVQLVFRITAITVEGNNIRLTWQTLGGTTNQVQVVNGAAGGGFTNNFSNLSPSLVITTPGLSSTNYLDVGGATNPSTRYYRIGLSQ